MRNATSGFKKEANKKAPLPEAVKELIQEVIEEAIQEELCFRVLQIFPRARRMDVAPLFKRQYQVGLREGAFKCAQERVGLERPPVQVEVGVAALKRAEERVRDNPPVPQRPDTGRPRNPSLGCLMPPNAP